MVVRWAPTKGPSSLQPWSDSVPLHMHTLSAVRVMAGDSLGTHGPIKLRNPGLLLDVRLAPGATFQQAVPTEWNGFAVSFTSPFCSVATVCWLVPAPVRLWWQAFGAPWWQLPCHAVEVWGAVARVIACCCVTRCRTLFAHHDSHAPLLLHRRLGSLPPTSGCPASQAVHPPSLPPCNSTCTRARGASATSRRRLSTRTCCTTRATR